MWNEDLSRSMGIYGTQYVGIFATVLYNDRVIFQVHNIPHLIFFFSNDMWNEDLSGSMGISDMSVVWQMTGQMIMKFDIY